MYMCERSEENRKTTPLKWVRLMWCEGGNLGQRYQLHDKSLKLKGKCSHHLPNHSQFSTMSMLPSVNKNQSVMKISSKSANILLTFNRAAVEIARRTTTTSLGER